MANKQPGLDDLTPEQLRAAARGYRGACQLAIGEATAATFTRLAERYERLADEREADFRRAKNER